VRQSVELELLIFNVPYNFKTDEKYRNCMQIAVLGSETMHGLMTRLVSDRSWSWSYTFGLAFKFQHCCARQALCEMIMLKCNFSFVQ